MGLAGPGRPRQSATHCHSSIAMSFTPVIAIHTTFALSALVLGPLALWTRLGSTVRPRWHRAAGYAWVTCMLGAALSAAFIRSSLPLSLWGFSPIHLLIVLSLLGLARAFIHLKRGNIADHRRLMQWLYLLAGVVTGLFTLLPGRLLGQLVWGDWLGWI
jgi:uncharacterized membrane protein